MEKTLDELEEENAQLGAELSINEKKAQIAEYKKRYGKDYVRVVADGFKGVMKSFKSNMQEPQGSMRPKP